MFVRYSRAFVIFPGGFGTLDELFESLISPGDKELLVTADTSEEVCDHVRKASAAQKDVA